MELITYKETEQALRSVVVGEGIRITESAVSIRVIRESPLAQRTNSITEIGVIHA